MRRIMFVLAAALLAVSAPARADEYGSGFCYSEKAANELAQKYASLGHFNLYYTSMLEQLQLSGECFVTDEQRSYPIFKTKYGKIAHGLEGVWQVVGYSATPHGPQVLFSLVRIREPFGDGIIVRGS